MRARLALLLIALSQLCTQICLADIAADIDTLDQCIQRLPAKQKDGLKQLTSPCPDLERTLEDAAVSDRLPPSWDVHLGRTGLRQVRDLLQHYRGEPTSAAPKIGSVSAIAEALRAQQPKRGWWQRFGEWLRRLLNPQGDRQPGPLRRLIEDLFDIHSQRVRQVILYGALVVVVALIAAIVWRELKASGGWGRGAGRAKGHGLPGTAAGVKTLDLSALDQMPLAARPAELLRLLVQALRQRGLLAGERTLTHRELTARAVLEDPQQRQRFAQVSRYAELQVYGPRQASPATSSELERTVREGRELYQQLCSGGSAGS